MRRFLIFILRFPINAVCLLPLIIYAAFLVSKHKYNLMDSTLRGIAVDIIFLRIKSALLTIDIINTIVLMCITVGLYGFLIQNDFNDETTE